MFEIYFPIAEIKINILLLISIGLSSGILSGMFGIGGGIISVPCLILLGIAPHIAVSASAYQIIGASFSGVLARTKTHKVDFLFGSFMGAMGIIGAGIGIIIVGFLKQKGVLDFSVSIVYILVMYTTVIGILKAAIIKKFFNSNTHKTKVGFLEKIASKSKWKMKIKSSESEVGIVFLAAIGLFVGSLVSLMGIGGGFVMIPIMTYILNIHGDMIVGTSLLQVMIITIFATFMSSIAIHSLDVMLGVILVLGAGIGSQIGSRFSSIFNKNTMNLILAAMIIITSGVFMKNLFFKPHDQYVVVVNR